MVIHYCDGFLKYSSLKHCRRPIDALIRCILRKCQLATCIWGCLAKDYGWEDDSQFSPTEHEFNAATEHGKPRLIYVKGATDADRHPKMRALISRAGTELIRRRFEDVSTLKPAVYASLVDFLEEQGLIKGGPFDASSCRGATLSDINDKAISEFIRDARAARGFPLPESASSEQLLTHLNLLTHGQPTNAAVLLFGLDPQRFLMTSEVKCSHFHGTELAKPIPSYQVYKGALFRLVDQAVDFVMSKIALTVGTRSEGNRAPVKYEIPREVVAEAIVNAVAHRDYASRGSVQVMLFADRLEVWNPGALPSVLTLEALRRPHGSFPRNPLVAEPLYLTRYIERMGTGTGDMIRRCRESGLPEPKFAIRDGFLTTISRNPLNSSRGTTQKTTQKTDERILEILRDRPQAGRREISVILGDITEDGVKYQIEKLKNAGRIRRVGPAKGGRWEVLE
jgi:ATP-dependent DNA helicase RecG